MKEDLQLTKYVYDKQSDMIYAEYSDGTKMWIPFDYLFPFDEIRFDRPHPTVPSNAWHRLERHEYVKHFHKYPMPMIIQLSGGQNIETVPIHSSVRVAYV